MSVPFLELQSKPTAELRLKPFSYTVVGSSPVLPPACLYNVTIVLLDYQIIRFCRSPTQSLFHLAGC